MQRPQHKIVVVTNLNSAKIQHQTAAIDSRNSRFCLSTIKIKKSTKQFIKLKLQEKKSSKKEWEIFKKYGECFKCVILHEIEMIRNDCHSLRHNRQRHVVDRQVLAVQAQTLVQVRHQRDHDSVTMAVSYLVLTFCEIHFDAQIHHR